MNEANAMIHGVPVDHYVYLSLILFTIGVVGVLIRRNMIVVLMCVELMLNAPVKQADFVFFIMVVAAAEAAVGLAVLIMIYRNTKSVDISNLDKLKG